ncbi:alpha-glucan family phosphorylase [Phototrophicus methaneseepsis]|uniref:Alpha-glucan family phosphorylase n=1 Tax=Phototrophicus methaneseepsis TaxID=2710758 RepID=A0A7S8IEF5_9CHLR|nr:alpha-glucan family phosphorylase [Phototrophicus methaneseepsis]QPC81778.1 alpha-glucan family phosphorylase [Phototrophicus methaneseepsis]
MVKPVATVHVVPKLPKALARLEELAYNMRFAWDHETISLFRRLDPDLWEETNHNPVSVLGNISQDRLNEVKNDQAYMASLERTLAEYDAYMNDKNTWYRAKYGNLKKDPIIAYFSMEFGITESFQNYSGGLGILSGDHLKSASDLGLPLVGVGILYQEGYFQQYLNADGWQQEMYPINDFSHLPLKVVTNDKGEPIKIDVPLPGRKLYCQIWEVKVGRVSLYLLDTNIPDNPRDEDRSLTDRLYGGDRRTRIRQEVVLGIGGIRALEALGLRPDVCHMNEGHSAFLSLERIRMMMQEKQITFYQAQEIIAASTCFTVHTPVPAGLERFGFDLIDEHFTDYMRDLGLTREQFIDLGRENMGDYELFSMSVFALHMSYGANGVAQLHGVVSRDMWQWMYPGVPVHEVPIGAITNGIHVQTWVSREMATLLDRYLDPSWRTDESNPEVWSGIDRVPDAELWRTHERRRERLVAFARRRLAEQLASRGASPSEIARADEVLNPDALTIGFARRFATYKRATLLFRDLDRLRELVNDPDRPVQFIFAGKAHPHDKGGKELIREIINVSRMPEFRHAVLFIQNYDMSVARYMVQGCDVWLNNPRRPKEASGTSGMKGIYNGCLNFSILDGWWAEGYSREVGWAIGNGEEYPEDEWESQDRIESETLYRVLENDILPKFYNRGRDGLPREWIEMMKSGIRNMAPFFTTYRMVQEYTDQFYIPNYDRITKMTAPGIENALNYANWRHQLGSTWGNVAVTDVNIDVREVEVGGKGDVTATVQLGSLAPENVRVQLYYGKLDTRGNIVEGECIDMALAGEEGNGTYLFKTDHKFDATGQQGLSVRVLPYHEYMHTSFQPNLITWA